MPKFIRNPILTGFNPDPSVARAGKDFFLTTSTFEFFPGLPIYHSQDLLNWRLVGHALTRRNQLEMRTVEPGAGIWAPTLRWRKDGGGENGRFYLATCKWDRYRPKTDERIFPRGFYVYTDNIWDENAWSEPIYFDNLGFDQDLFWDDDGEVYLSTTTRLANRPPNSTQKDFAIHISKVDITTGRTLAAPVVIRSSPYGIAEGSHIIKRGGYYYLFTAEGGTESGHQEWVLRSEKSPLGPWTLGPKNPLWYNGPSEEVQNTGHVDVFEDAGGNWWAVLLGVRPRRINGDWEESPLGRETFLVRVHWENDWPVFNNGQNITLITAISDDDTVINDPRIDVDPLVWKADFSKSQLELGWYHKNTPLKTFHSLTERPGYLRIHGGCYSLSSPEAPTMLVRKQTNLNQSFEATLEFFPRKEGYEAGIVIWWSMYSYASIGITSADSGSFKAVIKVAKQGLVREMNSSNDWNAYRLPKLSSWHLCIRADAEEYSLVIGSERSSLCSIKVRDLIDNPPVGGAFTGMMFGLYAFGNGEPCLDPADFSDVSCTDTVSARQIILRAA